MKLTELNPSCAHCRAKLRQQLRRTHVVLNEKQIRAVINDAIKVSAAAMLYVPKSASNKRVHDAANRILRRFTDILKPKKSKAEGQ